VKCLIDQPGLFNKLGIINTSPILSTVNASAAANGGLVLPPGAPSPATYIVPDGTAPQISSDGHWAFSKTAGQTYFMNWYCYNPRYVSPSAPLTFTKAQTKSLWCLVRPNVNIYGEGYISMNIYTYNALNPPTSSFYNTRWAYGNNLGAATGATGLNLFAGQTYLLYAYDAPKTTNIAGQGGAVSTTSSDVGLLRDPYDIHPEYPHIALQRTVIAFNPNALVNYRTWNSSTSYVTGDKVVFSGTGTNNNGFFYVAASSSLNQAPITAAGVPDTTHWTLIDPQPTSFKDEPVLAMGLFTVAAATAVAINWTVLEMGYSQGPDLLTNAQSLKMTLGA